MQASDTQSRLRAALAGAWRRHGATVLARVEHLERALGQLRRGELTEHLRREAAGQAHRLAGTLGTFGFEGGAHAARQVETLLNPDQGQTLETLRYELPGLLNTLRRTLRDQQEGLDQVGHALEEPEDGSATLLVVDADPEVVAGLKVEASPRGFRVRSAHTSPEAREEIAHAQPDVAVLDLSTPGALDLLRDLTGRPRPVPVLVFTDRDSLTDRVEVARLGGCSFLQKPLPATQVVDAVADQLERLRAARGRVLIVDDEQAIVDAVTALLEAEGLQVRSLDDSREFWEVLEEFVPDLLVLDFEMPFLNGLELCRVVRNDPRWSALPVMFLSLTADPETINAMFEAGADDFVAKSQLGQQLLTRLRNRLERTRLFTRLAETDPLTGLANRRKSAQVISRFMLLAERQGQPLSVALLDLDGFKAINDRHGHAAGDRVLRRLGALLLASFRGEDVVARWGGEEMAVGMFGMNREDGVHRLAEVLEAFKSCEFEGRDGQPFHVSFSAGVAQFPENGTDLHSLYRAADDALYLAKAQGRSRILPAGWTPPQERPGVCDATLVAADGAIAELMKNALNARGYTFSHSRRLDEALDALGNGVQTRALLVDVEPPDLDGFQRLETLLQEDRFPAGHVVLLVPETRTVPVPLPDSPGVRLLGRNFQVYELMRVLRTVWKQ